MRVDRRRGRWLCMVRTSLRGLFRRVLLAVSYSSVGLGVYSSVGLGVIAV